MMPILYGPNERAFDSNGFGILGDAVSCEVNWEKNGQYELTLAYPNEGIHAADITENRIILAKPAPDRRPQPFRIYHAIPSSSGRTTYHARHVAYDCQGIPAAPFEVSSLSSAMMAMRMAAVLECPFTFSADFSSVGPMAPTIPKSLWELMGTGEDGALATYGGEWEFDRFDMILHERMGTDTGYSIRYGKNLKTLEMDRNIANCYTGIYPFWKDSDGNMVQLPGKILRAEGEFDHEKIMVVDLSSEFEEAPSVAELTLAGQEYILANNIGIPTVSWKIEFVDLRQTAEYRDHPGLGSVSWGDSVGVVFPALRVNASARVVATRYNVLLDRYINITLGSVQASIADTIVANKRAQQLKAIQMQREYLARMKKLAEEAKKLAEDAQKAAEEHADEVAKEAEDNAIEHTDELDKKLDQEGIFNRLTNDGKAQGMFFDGDNLYFNATYILTGILIADLIKAGILQSADGKAFYLDLEKSILKMNATEFTLAGKTLQDIADERAEAKLEEFSELLTEDLDSLQKQIDGNITAWFGTVVPTTSNRPANQWTDKATKDAHLNDLYYNTETGYCYRWIVADVVNYSWEQVQDSDILKAMKQAANAQDTADGKRRVFIDIPDPPYDRGDLWTQGEDGDLMVCQTSRKEGYYNPDDWVLASKYISKDDVDDWFDEKTQTDIFNKLTNNGEEQGIHLKNGKIYINMEYLVTKYLEATKIALRGQFEVYNDLVKGGYLGYISGSTGSDITSGIGLMSTDETIYVAVTTGGAIMRAGSTNVHMSKNGDVVVNGNLTVTGTLSHN